MRPTSMRMVVVFPAPLGPRKPKTSPAWTSKEAESTIVLLPMTFVRFRADSAMSGMFVKSPRFFPAMRRFFFWYLPLIAAIAAALAFGAGFYSFLRGETGTPVDLIPAARASTATAPQQMVAPIIMGDSLARGAGDTKGLGIGGRLDAELKRRNLEAKKTTNIAINGTRTTD